MEPGNKMEHPMRVVSPDNVDESRYYMPIVRIENAWPAISWEWKGHSERKAHYITGQVVEYNAMVWPVKESPMLCSMSAQTLQQVVAPYVESLWSPKEVSRTSL